MARYAYDVNTTQRYIDVHKQFQGGLKTVDTDDALGAVFLRQAENVSLSEFGFIEKRYGTYENFKKQISGNLQGYWEFEGNIVYAVNGNFYFNDNLIKNYYFIGTNRYPEFSDIFTQGNFAIESDSVRITDGSAFQTTRDMNGVNINSVLYIFTGTYPVYLVKEDNLFKFYLFPIEVPTYDEIVVTGHNLLEDNYEGLYFSETSTLPVQTTSYNQGLLFPKINDSQIVPTLANRKDPIKFFFNTQYPQDMDTFSTLSNNNYFEINLDSVSFRNTGAGASTLDFLPADITDVNFQKKSNYSGLNALPSRGDAYISRQPFNAVDFKSTQFDANFSTIRRNEYKITVNFEITKNDFLKNNKYIIELYRYLGDFGFINFVLEDYKTNLLAQYNQTILKITPIDFNGNELKKQAYEINLLGSVNYSFNVPSRDLLNQDSTIEKYAFELFTKTAENYLISDGAQGPTDLKTNPENYYFDVVAISSKDPATSGNIITSSFVPSLNFEFGNLLSGRYDFRVKFVREEWRRVTQNGQFQYLELVQREFFETIITDVIITEERLEDFPRKDENSIGIDLPKLKSVWSCNKVIEHFNKLMIWGSTEMSTAVFYSFPDRPFYFPTKFYLDFPNDEGSALQNITPYMNILVAQTEDRTWGVRGNSGLLDAPAPYIPFTINPTVGTIAYKSVRPVRNHLFFLSKQGIIALKSLYAADEQYNIEFVDLNIRNIVPQDTQAVGIQYDNQYWLNFPNFGITLRWYIDKKAWVQDKYTTWNQFNGVFKYQIKDGKLEFITHPSRFEENQNLGIYKIGVDYSLPTDLGQAVVAKFETSFLNQNYPFHPKNYKETKMDFTLQNEYNLGRLPIYEMETNEDISGNIHTIQNGLIKNHRYRLEYDFTEQETTIIDGGEYLGSTFDDILDGGFFTGSVFDPTPLDLLFYYAVSSVALNGLFLELFPVDYETVEFLLPNNIGTNEDLIIFGDFSGYTGGAYLRDVTYDDILAFNAWVLSEEQTLNIDNFEGYDPSLAQVGLDLTLKDRFGDWVFGSSDFGNKVTAVKTIKLSGRGYNSKIYIEDFSKSKWTLESLGITYKMKRARSR